MVNGIHNLPKFEKLGRSLRTVLGDWELTGIYSYNTGVPLYVFSGYDLSGTNNQRADIVGDPRGPHTSQK